MTFSHTNGTRKPNDTDPSDAAGLRHPNGMSNTDDIHTNDTRKPNDMDHSDAAGLPQNREGHSPTPRPHL